MAYNRKWSGSQSKKSSQRTKFSQRGQSRKNHKVPLAVKVARIARDLKPELKCAYFYNNAAQVGTVGSNDSIGISNSASQNYYISNWPIGAMIEGNNEAQRVGRKIRLKHVDFAFFCQANNQQASSF